MSDLSSNNMLQPSAPDYSQHMVLAGRTGTGKTTGGLDMLSRRLEQPWIIVDRKLDDNLAMIPAKPFDPRNPVLPDKGLHIVRPHIDGRHDADVEDMYRRILRKKRIGVMIDEGHLEPKSTGLRNLMVAGRQPKCPVMFCSQRASWIDTFYWSQATFFRVYDVQTEDDVKKIRANMRMKWATPDKYHSYYYDGTQGEIFYLAPSPPIDVIVANMEDKLLKSFGRL